MFNYEDLDLEQVNLINRLYEHDSTLVYATMGSGKTVCALTAAAELVHDKVLNRVLIVAPLKPAKDVWPGEPELWGHLKDLDMALALGNADKRKKAILSSAPFVIINIENLAWFCDEFKGKHNFDGLIIDELSKFKDSSAKVVKKMRYRSDDFKWRVGLTGSPVHESYTGLFGQMLVLDGGKTFGRNKEKFLHNYFYPTDYEQRNWEVRENMRGALLNALCHVWYTMPDYTDTLPAIHEIEVPFELSTSGMGLYSELKKHSVLNVDGEVIVADNAAVLSGKLEQLTSGFLYTEDSVLTPVYPKRMLEFSNHRQTIDGTCLVFYTFEEEKQQIIDVLKDDYATLDTPNVKYLWNEGKINNLLLHPKSAGHGLNLQRGGHNIIWYSPIWSNDMFKQAIARLWRRGQKDIVYSYTLVCKGTVDELKVQRVDDKQEHDKLLREHFNG